MKHRYCVVETHQFTDRKDRAWTEWADSEYEVERRYVENESAPVLHKALQLSPTHRCVKVLGGITLHIVEID